MTSLLDCPRLTWSLGCTGSLAADGPAQNLDGPVGDDLVRVHIGRRARPGLENVDGKMIVPLALDDLVGRLLDGVGQLVVQQSQRRVGPGRRPLDDAQRPNELPRHAQPADLEVVDGSLRLRPVVRVRGNAHFTHGIRFNPYRQLFVHLQRNSERRTQRRLFSIPASILHGAPTWPPPGGLRPDPGTPIALYHGPPKRAWSPFPGIFRNYPV